MRFFTQTCVSGRNPERKPPASDGAGRTLRPPPATPERSDGGQVCLTAPRSKFEDTCERGWDRTIDLCLIRTAFYH